MTQDVTAPPPTAAQAALAAYTVAAVHQASQADLRAAVVAAILAEWAKVNPRRVLPSWLEQSADRVFVILSAGQEAVAAEAGAFVGQALAVQGIPVSVPALDPLRFAGIASDGRDLENLLRGAPVRVLERLGQGARPEEAMRSGAAFLTLAAATQISDAARAADQVALTVAEPADPRYAPASPAVEAPPAQRKFRYGWVRMLTPPSCSRCAILAGQFYKWNEGFIRHEMCDCKHIPAAESLAGDLATDPMAYFRSLTPEEQNKYFGVANARAINAGADIFQVVNASTRPNAMYVADNGRRYTREGTTRRGFAGSRGAVVRPTPWQIFRDARGNREEAIRQLRESGYILR